ncbi:hypothetical protein D1007_56496 [Hordeum vulgare]|nr:hypothetical protein D1007_56496 [Hordeum vulgare]
MAIKHTIGGSSDSGFEFGAGKAPKLLLMLGNEVALPVDEVSDGQRRGHNVASLVVPPKQEALLDRDYDNLSHDHSSNDDSDDSDDENSDDDGELKYSWVVHAAYAEYVEKVYIVGWFRDLSLVYTNNHVWVENSIHIMEQLLADDKYKVVGFDLEYTDGGVGHDQKKSLQSFPEFVNSPDYMFDMVEDTNYEKVLKTTGLACRNLVDIQCEYKILGSEEKHKDSLVDLVMAIIDPYYSRMTDVHTKEKVA